MISAVPGDGTLTISALLPGTGDHAAAGAATEAGVQLAARDITASLLGPVVSLSVADAATSAPVAGTVDAVVVPFPASGAAFTGVVLATLGSQTGATPTDAFVARLKKVTPALKDATLAPETYDAVTAIAIAEVIAGSDSAVAVGSALPLLANGGYTCTSFGDCVTAISQGEPITYRGQAGTAARSGTGVTIGALTITAPTA